MNTTCTSDDAPVRRRGTVLAVAVGLLVTLAGTAVACSDDDLDSGSGSSADGSGADADDDDDGEVSPDWVRLGNDLGHSRAAATETEIGADNIADLAPSWELADIKGLTGTPLVAEGVVYIGDWTGHVRALDAETGDEQWATDVDSYYIGGSVALDDERVFVGTFDGRVVALDRGSGEELWTAPIGDHPQAAIFGSPIVVDGLVIMGVASYELMTGNAAPTFKGHVVALEAGSGEEVWRYWTVGEDEVGVAGVSVWASVTVDTGRGHVYVPTGNGYGPEPSTRSDAVVALDLATGEELWVTQFTVGDVWTVANPVGTDADVGSPPNLFTVGDVDALGVADKAGVYRTLERDTGEILWEAPLTEGGLQGGTLASAAVAEGVVYVASNRASQDADLVALDAETGDEQWRIDVGGHVSGPVSWANGVVYLADDTARIVAYDAADGTVLWTHEVPEQAAGGVSIVDGTVYAGWGWWFTSPPDDAQGGLIAFRLGPADGGTSGGSGSGSGSGSEDGEAASGEAIYQDNCARCHGEDGSGASGPALEGVADRLTEDQHREIVEEGRGAMPGWADSLSDEEIEAVIAYQRETLSG